MSTPLTDDQIDRAVRAVSDWLRIKSDNDQEATDADADHSALLRRLLSGKSALPVPPPVMNGYPVYPEEATPA